MGPGTQLLLSGAVGTSLSGAVVGFFKWRTDHSTDVRDDIKLILAERRYDTDELRKQVEQCQEVINRLRERVSYLETNLSDCLEERTRLARTIRYGTGRRTTGSLSIYDETSEQAGSSDSE